MTRVATPALPAPDIRDRAFWTSGRVGTAVAPVVESAGSSLGMPWPEARASQFARFWRDGDRKDYEGGVIGRQQRLTYAAVAALHTGEERFVDEVVDGAILLCEQSTWCWAAHDHTRSRNGWVVADVDDPCLDLGAGEVAAQLAWVDHLLGPALDDRAPGVRARIRHETQRRVLHPFTDRRDWWWLGVNRPLMNWSPWIQGNVLAAALALENDAGRRRHIIDLVDQGISAYWDSLPADGGVDEGYHYWWQGAARALEAQDLLDWARTAAATSDARAKTIREIVAFPHRMHLGGDWYVGVADSPARPIWTWPWNLVHAWARRVGDDDAARHAASYRDRPEILWDERDTLSRAVLLLADDEWAALPSDDAPPLVGEVWLPETQVALARSRPGAAEGITVVVKGGHNGENHNHNDVGEVLVALDGVPVVVDAGKPTYRAGTFDEARRYAQWPMRSAWHNVPLIRGAEQSPGAGFTARAMAVTPGDGPWTARLDVAGAYPCGESDSWCREVTLDRDAESVIVTDTWDLAGIGLGNASGTGADQADRSNGSETSDTNGDTTGSANNDETCGPTTLHWLLAGDVGLDAETGNATVRHAADRPDDQVRSLLISWDAERVEAALDTRQIDDDELATVWGDHLTRLSLTLRGDAPAGTFAVRFAPAQDSSPTKPGNA